MGQVAGHARSGVVGEDARGTGVGHSPADPTSLANRALAQHAVTLQRTIGNRATANTFRGSISREPAKPATPAQKRSRLQDDVGEMHRLYGQAAGFNSDSQTEVLRLILLNADRAEELKTAYQEQLKRPLSELINAMSPANAFRANEYLAAKKLRPGAKVMIALSGLGTTEDTLWRVLPELFPNAESEWSAVATDHPDRTFAKETTLDAALVEETSGWELDKARALVRFGTLRPEDKVRVGANRMFPDTALIFEGLRSISRNTYENHYHQSLPDLLFDHPEGGMLIRGKLSGKDAEYAKSLLGDDRSDPDRLVKLAQQMESGINDFSKLLNAVQLDNPTAEQLRRLKAVVSTLGGFGGFNDEELAQLNALLDLPGASPQTAAVLLLKSKGGVSDSTIIPTLLTMNATDIAVLGSALDKEPTFAKFLDSNLRMLQRMVDAPVILKGSLWDRIRWGAKNDEHAYVVSLLSSSGFSSEADRLALGGAIGDLETGKTVSGDAGVVANQLRSAFGTTKLNAIRDACGTGVSDVLQQAQLLEAQMERERSVFTDLFATDSGEAAALRDERVQLRTQAEQAMFDGTLSPTEKAQLGAQVGRTGSALSTYVAARDEFAGYAQTAATAAIGILATIGTGGAAGPALIAATLRAAAASAVARVIAEAALKGDRFDFDRDGTRAFVNGFTDGAMNVLGAGMAEGVLKAVGGPAVSAALQGGEKVGLRIAKEAIDNAIGGAVGNAVETIIKDGTWSKGVAEGLEKVFVEAGLGVLQGAAMGAGMEVLKIGGAAVVGYFKSSAVLGRMMFDDGACRSFLHEFESWEAAIGALRDGVGKADGIPDHQRKLLMAVLQRHRNKVIALLDATFEAKPVGAASKNPESDADLNISGSDAGARLLACRQFLDAQFPGWAKTYRMALMIGSERVSSLENVASSLSLVEREAIRKSVSLEVEALTTARRMRGIENPEERAALLQGLNPQQRNLAEGLAAMSSAELSKRHDAALLAGDDAMQKLSMAKTPEEKLKWAKEATHQQMLANAIGSEAYIAPASVQAFVTAPDAAAMRSVLKSLDPARRYDVLLDQIDMISHQVHASGGVLKAMRNYECYKYIERFIATVEAAGIEDSRITYLKSIADLHYRVDRQASKAVRTPINLKDLAGGVKDAEIRVDDAYINSRSVTGPDDKFLLTYWNDFANFADQHAAALRVAAHGGPALAGSGSPPPSAPVTGTVGGTVGGKVTSVPRPTTADVAAADGPKPSAEGPTSPAHSAESAPDTERNPEVDPDAAPDTVRTSNRPAFMTWDISLSQRQAAVLDYANVLARRAGIPPTTAINLKDIAGASFDPAGWCININPKYFDEPLSREMFDELIVAINHEVRHGEQFFHIARWRKMEALKGPIHEHFLYRVHPDVDAAARQMVPGDPFEVQAKEWHASFFGSASLARENTYKSMKAVSEQYKSVEARRTKLEAALSQSSFAADELREARELRDALFAAWKKFDQRYRELVEEIDAYKVGHQKGRDAANHLESVFEPERVRERARARAQEGVHDLTLKTALLDDEIRTKLGSGIDVAMVVDLQAELMATKTALAQAEVALADLAE
jgi:hypothetical protein